MMSDTQEPSFEDEENAQMKDASTTDTHETPNQEQEKEATKDTDENEKTGKRKRKKKKKSKEDEEPEEDWRARVPVPCEGGPLEEKKLIQESDWERVKVKKGETYYIISAKWFGSWRDYVNYDNVEQEESPRPGPIINEYLIRPDTKDSIRKEFSEGKHYEILPESAWKNLVTWYGGGPPLPRGTIPSSSWSDHYVVEVRPLNLKIVKSSQMDVEHPFTVSKIMKVRDFHKKICKKLGLRTKNVRVWDFHARNKIKLLLNMDEQLDEASIIDNQIVLFEEKDAKGNWPAYNPYGRSYSAYSEPSEPGIVGLNNLGNTCFMNSSLQCLSNTPPLVNFFLTGAFKDNLNRTNPLGMKGELAEEYCNLLKELWSGASRATAPRTFKHKLEHFAPQFSGYQQHDSQELLGFLLDGLHEDLNRVLKKPYIETKESAGRPDEEVADEAWVDHRARNDSVIVDWFQGQLKSTLVCPDCGKVSITFDPFMYLSLPLPMKTTRDLVLYVNFDDPLKIPLKIKLSVFMYGTVGDLKKAAAELLNIPVEGIIMTDVYDSRFFREFKDSDSIDVIQDRDFVYVNEVPVTLPPYPPVRVPPPIPPRTFPATTSTSGGSPSASGGEGGSSNVEGDSMNEPPLDPPPPPPEDTQELPAQTSEAAPPPTDDGLQNSEKEAIDGEKPDDSKMQDVGEKEKDSFSSSSSDDDWNTGPDEDDYPSYYNSGHSSKPLLSATKPVLAQDAIVYVSVVHRRDELIEYRTYYKTPTTYTRKSLFGNPMIVGVRRNITYKDLYRTILSKLKRYVKVAPEPEPEVVAEATESNLEETTTNDEGETTTTPGAAEGEATTQVGEETEMKDTSAEEKGTENKDSAAEETEMKEASTTEEKEAEEDKEGGDDDKNDDGSEEDEVKGSDNGDNTSSSSSSSDEEEEEEEEREEEITDLRFAPIDGKYPLFVIRAVDNFGMNEKWVLENNDEPLNLDPRQTLAIVWTEEALAAGVYDKDEEEKLEVHPSAEEKVVDTETEKDVTLLDCVELFAQTEKLGPEDPWYCSQCKEFRQATKKFDLWRMPKILVVHLKRFSYKNKYWRDKLETYVDYPEDNLDFSQYVRCQGDAAPVYELYAVSNHYGSLGGGHYTAYAKNHRNGKWYGFDDSSVTEASTSKIHSSAAYVLFYRRKDAVPEDWVQLSVDEARRKARGGEAEESEENKEEDKDGEKEKDEEEDETESSTESSSTSYTTTSDDEDDGDDEKGGNLETDSSSDEEELGASNGDAAANPGEQQEEEEGDEEKGTSYSHSSSMSGVSILDDGEGL